MAARSEEAARAFLRHRLLQLRSRELAEGAIRSISLGKDDRIEIDFGAGAPYEVEKVVREARDLRLEHSAPPIGVGGTPPPLQIAILVVGTRGDVQPFIPIGQRLLRDGHRVRLATHAVFREFVESNGLEFYPLGGDPKALIAYMVKTGGALLPSSLGEIVEDVPAKRRMLEEIIESCWGACTLADPGRLNAAPFRADALIGNPPCYGHVHMAEKLRIPLHMMFTLPWTPTTAFPQPFANLSPGRHPSLLNWLSYSAVDLLLWAGIGDIVNRFRKRLGLPGLHIAAEGANVINDRAVPFTYLWSPALIPKPDDWHDNVDIADFILFEPQNRFEPPPELVAFLGAGAPPIYVGFGSCVVENPEELTRIIFAALEAAGARGVVAAGWTGLGGGEVPPNVYHLVGECAHDWLFPRCAAVCHHGGAGTTAAGLRCNRPTVIVPFFGDQPFWGHRVATAGAGPAPIPICELSVERLAAAFHACTLPEVRARAAEIGAVLRSRRGADLAVEAFYRHLPDTASGALSYLGFGAAEQARVAAGEIVTVSPTQQPGTISLSAATRLACSLDRFCELAASGRLLELDPQAVAWGHLGEDTRPGDFARVGLQPDQTAEVETLLTLRAGETYNFSSQEIERFASARARLGSSPNPEARREAVNEVLRGVLFERMRAYREGGLDGIAPYARAGGRRLSPADELHATSRPDSLFATEFRGLYEAFMGFPRIPHPDALHRFSWIERRSAEGPYFVLEHRMLARYLEFAVMAVRQFYVTRHYDALSLTVGALREGEEILVMATWSFAAEEHLTGVRGFVEYPRARRRVREVLMEHVAAIRAAVKTGDSPVAAPP